MYGLYLYRSSKPLFTGTKKQCRDAVNNLTDAEILHGWIIQPVPKPRKPLPPAPRRRSDWAWALVGVGVLVFVAVTSYFALKGHI